MEFSMEMMPILWLCALVLLVVVELLTYGLTTIWFAGGSLVALIVALCKGPIWLQCTLFFAVSILLLLFTRPIAIKYANRNTLSSNVGVLVGKKTVVTKEIHNLAQEGQVKINDIEWMARSLKDEDIIPKGTTVEVVSVEGTKLTVKRV
ncbi:MAG TPA: NfeD family protein [Lachnospiraceae bacterium]